MKTLNLYLEKNTLIAKDLIVKDNFDFDEYERGDFSVMCLDSRKSMSNRSGAQKFNCLTPANIKRIFLQNSKFKDFACFVKITEGALMTCAMLSDGKPDIDDAGEMIFSEVTQIEQGDEAFLNAVNERFETNYKIDDFF